MSTDRSSRQPPRSLDAERGVIGSALLDPALLDELPLLVAPEDFFRDAHHVLYRVLLDLRDRGKPVDVVTLCDELERRNDLHAVGGDEAIREILDATPHAANGRYYAGIVRERAVARRLLDASTATLEDVYAGTLTAAEILSRAEERVYALAEREVSGDTRPASEFAAEAMERLTRRDGGSYAGIDTGFSGLDNTTDGLANGQLVVLAARPSIGKSAFALQVAERSALRSGTGVLFISLEMNGVELAERLLVGLSGVDGHRVRVGGDALTELHRAALDDAYRRLRACPNVWIDDTPGRTVGQIAANARRHRARHRIGLVVVDYLQLVDPGADAAPRSSRQEQVAAISRRLKALARELDVPVLALAQLNRQSESREDRRPRLADLRESGSIEADADMVLLLHRPEFYDPNDQPGVAELIIAKNRNGPTGTVRLQFDKPLARFADLAPFDGGAGPGEPDF